MGQELFLMHGCNGFDDLISTITLSSTIRSARKPISSACLDRQMGTVCCRTARRHRFSSSYGVIEGACRHLVKDRMNVTGARWRLTGAEAVLRLRALRSSNDFDAYWSFTSNRNMNATTPHTTAITVYRRWSRR